MYRGLPPRRRLERTLPSGERRKLHRRSAGAASTAATTTTQQSSRGRVVGQTTRSSSGRTRPRQSRGSRAARHAADTSPPPPPEHPVGVNLLTLSDVLPLWCPTPKVDLERRTDFNNVLLALGLKPTNRKAAEKLFFSSSFDSAEHNRMHGIMEGSGEELTVAAVTSEGLNDHHSHHHHNGVSASPVRNGTSPLPKDAAPASPPLSSEPCSPPQDPSPVTPPEEPPTSAPNSPANLPAENGPAEQMDQDCSENATASESNEIDTKDTEEKDLSNDKEDDATLSTTTSESEQTTNADAADVGSTDNDEKTEEVEDPGSLQTEPTTEEEKICQEEGEETEAEAEIAPKTESETEDKDDCENNVPSVDNLEKDTVIQEEQEQNEVKVKEEITDSNQADSIKEDASVASSEEPPVADETLSAEEAVLVTEAPPAVAEDIEGDNREQPLETSVKVEEAVVKDKVNAEKEKQEKSSAPVVQKRTSSEDGDSSQPKKKSRPDSNALDLSSFKKDDTVSKEVKIAVKPQSLLLSKLTSSNNVDKQKNDSSRSEEKKPVESLRSAKTISATSRTERRRSSREEKDRTVSRRRSTDTPPAKTTERDQVLREMRDRVLSSYKERERAARDECLLRELLEPERDAVLSELVDAATQNGGVLELDRVYNLLSSEIRQLNVQINTKEMEWNELIRKRKLKEELQLRLQRRKQVLVLTADCEDDRGRNNSYEDDVRLEPNRVSRLETRLENRSDNRRDLPIKTGEELLATALRLGSRNVEDYHHQASGNNSSLAVRIQARANELLIGAPPPIERKSNGPLPGLSHLPSQSLLQSQLSQSTDLASTSPQSQFLLQHLQRQRVLMGAGNNSSACRLSSSVSLSAIPTSTSSPALGASSPSSTNSIKISNSSRMEKHQGLPSSLRVQRPILPKPSTATSGGHVVSEDPGGAGVIGEGRQGPILDVKSIIADYRSKHPEGVPRRGRRMKPNSLVPETIVTGTRHGSSGGGLLSMSLPALGSGSHVRTAGPTIHAGVPVDLSELGFVLSSGNGSDGPSRPSSTESSLSNAASQHNQDGAMSYKDVLVQIAKMNEQNILSNSGGLLGRPPPPPYPEVTLHPVVSQMSACNSTSSSSPPTTSLLHGILTKPSSQSSNTANQPLAKPTTFSPTLARLLTAPERSSSSGMTVSAGPPTQAYAAVSGPGGYPPIIGSGPVLLSDLLSGATTNKGRGELTITPVTGSPVSNHSQGISAAHGKQEVVVIDGEDHMDVNGDEGDGDTDSDERRLIIDEGEAGENGDAETNCEVKPKVPHCQGCNERDAEFVCAGCQNQWYCSRECQIASWDEHSELCFPPNQQSGQMQVTHH